MTNTVCLVKQCKRTIMFNNITTLFNNNVFSRSRLEKRTSNLWAGKGEKIPGHIYRNVEVTFSEQVLCNSPPSSCVWRLFFNYYSMKIY